MEFEWHDQVPGDSSISGLGIQDSLSLGYVILLILGVIHETIYYKFLGVNILEYSSVLDVLISPVSVISGNLILGFAVIFCPLFALMYAKLLPKYYKWLAKKPKYQTGKNKDKLDKMSSQIDSKSFLIIMTIVFVFSMFIGLGIGRGSKIKDKITKSDITFSHVLIFEDGDTKEIKMLGKNSLYVFYVTKGNEEISISPIDGNIKTIKKLKKQN